MFDVLILATMIFLTSFPYSVKTVLFLGSIFMTVDLTHLTPEGITLAVERADALTVLAPAPTNVHMGW